MSWLQELYFILGSNSLGYFWEQATSLFIMKMIDFQLQPILQAIPHSNPHPSLPIHTSHIHFYLSLLTIALPFPPLPRRESRAFSYSHFIIFAMMPGSKLIEQPAISPTPVPPWTALGSSQTVDFGIQVDLNQNPQSQSLECEEDGSALQGKGGLSCEQRRKMKKKLNKKRRRQKQAEMQRQARRQIGNIIQEFYEGRAKFDDYRGKIEVLVELIYNNDFRDYLDQLIRMRVNYIQKAIWEYTQSILEDSHFQKSDDHIFYSQMVDKIFDTFLDIEDSSQQIEKIINIYLRFAYQKSESKEEIIYNNLAINTFNYMIETDDTLKNLLHICDKKISPARVETRKKLEELISIIDCYYDDYQDDLDQSTTCPQDDLQSTGHSEEEEPEERKKRRRKVKENDLLCEEEVLLKRLNSMVIREEDRQPCRIEEGTLREWQKRLKQRQR